MRRIGITVAIALVALVAAVIVFFVIQQRGAEAGTSPDPDPTFTSHPTETDEPAEQVAQMIRSVVDNPSEAVTDELREEADLQSAIPLGSSLDPLVDTWASDGFGGGIMSAVLRVPGEPDEYYLVVVVEDSGTWKIMGTFEQVVEQ